MNHIIIFKNIHITDQTLKAICEFNCIPTLYMIQKQKLKVFVEMVHYSNKQHIP